MWGDRRRHGGGRPVETSRSLVAAAVANADKWAGGSAAPDLLLEVELVRHPLPHGDQCLAMALNTEGAESKMSRRLVSLMRLGVNLKSWKEWFAEVERVYKRMSKVIKGEGDNELMCFLTKRQRRNLEVEGDDDFMASRELEVLTAEFWAYGAMHSTVQREASRGRGDEAVALMRKVFQDIQDARIRFADSRNLALWKTHQILNEFVDAGCLRIADMYEEGLLGAGGPPGALEKRGGKEGGGRSGSGDFSGRERRETGDGKGAGPELPLCREVETYPDGRAILNRAGNPWRWHICKACAEAGRWPGHHPKQCDHSYPDWRTNPPK